jgi:small subunit ribosomal protein S9
VRIARALSGKHKPTWTPHIDDGDHVIVLNAEKIELGGKKWDQKLYYRHSNYPGGLRVQTAREIADKHPERLVEKAVRGMLAGNRMRDVQLRRLSVYTGAEHPHDAQHCLNEPVEVIQSTGRRKRAVARVKLMLGQGIITVNNKPIDEYFSRPQLLQIVRQPLEATQSVSRFDVRVKAEGGGVTGQAGAIRHGIARALVEMDESLKETMRKNGFLTRDPREKESKKYGRKRARKRFQYSKR